MALRGTSRISASIRRVLITNMERARHHEAGPEAVAEQIKAIYPIVKGQKPDGVNLIPPHTSSSPTKAGRNGQAVEPQVPAKEENLIDL